MSSKNSARSSRELRGAGRGFAWRLTVLQGVLRWAAPGRQAYLLALAALAAGRLLTELGRAVMGTGQATVMVLGDTAWLGRESRQVPGHGAGPARDRPQSHGTGPR